MAPHGLSEGLVHICTCPLASGSAGPHVSCLWGLTLGPGLRWPDETGKSWLLQMLSHQPTPELCLAPEFSHFSSQDPLTLLLRWHPTVRKPIHARFFSLTSFPVLGNGSGTFNFLAVLVALTRFPASHCHLGIAWFSMTFSRLENSRSVELRRVWLTRLSLGKPESRECRNPGERAPLVPRNTTTG